MRKLIFALLLAFAPVAHGTTLVWTPPTENTDGSTLVDLAGYQIFQWLKGGTPTLLATVGAVTSYTPSSLPVGVNCFQLRTLNAAGKVSSPTSTVCATVTAQSTTPNAPTNVNITL